MIHVAVGIVINQQGEILIAQRPAHASYGGGLWEFPGGKLEAHEDVFTALQREFQEEIGIQIISADPWLQIHYDYKDRVVLLDTWLIKEYSGQAHGAEGQIIRWIKSTDLNQYKFPDGNREIIEKLQSTR
ncbi:MAG: 8-oxo-dGTP diphosphatase MutT [Gammaproteobacteria bacterium]